MTMSRCLLLKGICKDILVKLHFMPVRTWKKPAFRTSELLGYYEKETPAPEYEGRKEAYRSKVLKPLDEMQTLEQRLEEQEDQKREYELFTFVDIGLRNPCRKKKINSHERNKLHKQMKEDRVIQNLARSKQLKIDLDKVRLDWATSSGPSYIQNVADHYNIFSDLFQYGRFTPWVPLHVFYNDDEEYMTPVYMGNILEARSTKDVPNVYFETKADDLWTLIFTNLEGTLLDTESEYLHWMVANIKGGDISSGQTICDYLQPFPFRGTGYHRLAFVLYKQDGNLDLSALQKSWPCLDLKQRQFKTFEFYEKYQDVLTPAGLSFFQCIWDSSLTRFFHNTLRMREPVFEYNQPPMYHQKQMQFPVLQPFSLYLDKYRDPKDIVKEVLLKRLKAVHPFEEEKPMPKYPCLRKPVGRVFSWQRDNIMDEKLRLGKYRDLRPHSVYPQEDDQGKYSYKN